MANSTVGVTEEHITSQTGSFHYLLAPFVVDVICMFKFHIVRLLPFYWDYREAGVSSLRASKGDPCGGFSSK